MVTILVVSFGFVIYRLPLLRARNELDSWVSREAAFLANNWILLFSAFFVLFATMFPTLSEAVTGERLTVGPPFFNKWMLPIGLMLLLLTGVGPLLAWRKSTLDQPARSVPRSGRRARCRRRRRCRRARRARLDVGHLLRAVRLRRRHHRPGVLARRARAAGRHRHRHLHRARSASSARNKRRYGGYIVHVGIVLIFLGFAGEGFKQDEQVLLKPGQQVKVGDFTVRLDARQGHRRRPEADDHGAHDRVPRRRGAREDVSGQVVLPEARGRADDRSGDPPLVRRGPLPRDAGVRRWRSRARAWRSYVNPLVNWVWLGFGILALGTGIALLPETAFAFARREDAGATP